MSRNPWASAVSLGCTVLTVWMLVLSSLHAAEELPLISKMVSREQVAKEKKAAEEAKFPRQLSTREAQLDVADLLPGGALLYLEMPSGTVVEKVYEETAMAQITGSRDVKRFLKENPFNFQTLLSDLPVEFSSPGTVTMLQTFSQLMSSYLTIPGMVSFSVYPGEDNEPIIVFLADIGRDRKATHEQLQAQVEAARSKSGELMLQKAEHTDDYLEILRVGQKGKGVELCYGFIRNYLILANHTAFANALLLRASEKRYEDSLGESQVGSNLAAKTSPKSHLRGFTNLFAILDMAMKNHLPESREAMAQAQGMMAETAFYYDLQINARGVVENITVPAAGAESGATVMTRLKAIVRKEGGFALDQIRSTKLMPYNPDRFVALKVKPDDLAALLQEKTFSTTGAGMNLETQLAGSLPALKEIFGVMGNQAATLLEGEVGIAVETEAGLDGKSSWTLAIPLKNTGGTVTALAAGSAQSKKIAGLEVYSRSGKINKLEPAWAVFAQTDTTFRNLGYSFLVVTSSGFKMERTIDSIVGGRAVLANNRDFQRQMARFTGDSVGVFYDNLLKGVQSNYFQLPSMAKELFPRLVGLHAMPQLTSITKPLFGMSGSLALNSKGEFALSTWSPFGLMPVTVAETLLSGPMIIRMKEEWLLMQSRKNLAELNLALQEYATQHGHYPAVIHGEVG
ncbi:MAG: hypothetical protein ACYTGH_13390, partial [Planctomycetota bacterium]